MRRRGRGRKMDNKDEREEKKEKMKLNEKNTTKEVKKQ